MKKMGLGILVLAALSGGGYFWFWEGSSSKPIYRKVNVTRADLESSLQSTGSVQPETRLEIKAPIAGRAEEVLVEEGQAVHKGQLLVWMSSTERAALLDAARARGAAELKRWEVFYKPTPVFASINGTVISRNIEPGQTFTTQDAILVMSDRLSIQAQVDETDIAQIRSGQKAEVELDAYPGQKISAVVHKVAFEAKTVSNVTTYRVDVLPDTVPPFMKSGMTANIRFLMESRPNALTLPAEAVQFRKGTSFVFVPPPPGTQNPVEKQIRTGLMDGKKIEVLSGLSEGEEVWVSEDKSKTAAPTGTNPFSSFGRGRRH